MGINDFEGLKGHVGHIIKCVAYGDPLDPANVAIECETCGDVLIDFDNPDFDHPGKSYKCDSLCIHYMEKDCHTEDEENGMCDQPDKYREVGDVADAMNDAVLFK